MENNNHLEALETEYQELSLLLEVKKILRGFDVTDEALIMIRLNELTIEILKIKYPNQFNDF